MAESAADQPLTSEELEEHFGPVEPIDDELLSSGSDLPILDTKPAVVRGAGDSQGLTRALWFVGIVVAGMLVLQAAQLFLARNAPPTATPMRGGEPIAVAPTSSTARSTPSDEIWSMLRDTRIKLNAKVYEDVIRVLAPLVEDASKLDAEQRFEAYLLLARAYRETGNVEKAQHFQLRATDQNIERREPAQAIEHAGTLVEQGLHEDARRELLRLLARRDAILPKDQDYLAIAETRVGDAWYAQAMQSGHVAPLPGADRAERKR